MNESPSENSCFSRFASFVVRRQNYRTAVYYHAVSNIDQTISHCRIIEKFGGGGMGVVDQVENTRHHHV